MKQFFAGALLITCLSLPASATSIEVVDDIVTGSKGPSSIVTMGSPQACVEAVCVDKSGGDAQLSTASTGQEAALGPVKTKKVNFDFARKFPDPSTPVPSSEPVVNESSNPLDIPSAPADSGRVAQQPPIQPKQDASSMGAPTSAAPVLPTRGSIDPSTPVIRVVSSENSENE